MYATINGTDIYYHVIGSGRPVLLMHGGLGLDHTSFRPWLDPLADEFQLIFYDISGNGRSPRPRGFSGVTHATWVDEADELRRHLGFERITLLGMSYGGFLAQEYALRYPDRLDGLILVSTAPALDYGDKIVSNARRRGTEEQAETVIAALTKPVESDDAFRTLWNKIFPLYFHRYDPEIAAGMDSRTIYSAGAFNHAFFACIGNYNVRERLPEIATRTLVLAGEDDWITPIEQAAWIHLTLPNADLHIFHESGHFPFVEEQSEFLDTLRTWMEGLS